MKLIKQFMDIGQVITEAHIYLNQVYAARKFSFGTWISRQQKRRLNRMAIIAVLRSLPQTALKILLL